MFIIYIWDKAIGKSIESLEDFSGNEKFLIQADHNKYPLLSELSNCDMELFSDEQLVQLRQEINRLLIEGEPLGENICTYLSSVISLVDRAYSDNQSVLFSPF